MKRKKVARNGTRPRLESNEKLPGNRETPSGSAHIAPTFVVKPSTWMFSHSYHHHQAAQSDLQSGCLPNTTEGASQDRIMVHQARLESLLDSALATLALIHDLSTSASVAYPLHVTEVLRALNRHILLLPASLPEFTPDLTSATSSAPMKPNHATVPDVILRFDLDPVNPPRQIFAAKVFATVHEATRPACGKMCMFDGARWTRGGNLALQISEHSFSPDLIIDSHMDTIWSALRPLLGYSEGHECPRVDSGRPWHSVVFRDVPKLPSRDQYNISNAQRWLATGGFTSKVKAVSVLCSPEAFEDSPSVSLRVSLSMEEYAQQLVDKGANLFGAWCRASHYVARSRVEPVAP
ncbi:hypothetical protein DFH09DRAFT_1353746 [Mycena vulgaris]|nr:hypothetical protein DFH09DRAFT_1353746 [Mycena vulgaris]